MRFPILFLLASLAACAPRFESGAPRDPHRSAVIGDEDLVTRDGIHLASRRWDAEGAPKAVIVALHGMSDYSNAFDMPGRAWAAQGITTIAYDQRGFGRNADPGIWAGADAMRADLSDAVDAARGRYPGVPVFALGESMGGAVVLTALASQTPPAVDGAILVAPAVWSRADMPLTYRAALFLAAHLMPGVILSNNAASRVVTIIPSDNVEMLRALGRDPLFQKRTRTDTLYGLVNLMDEARTAPARLNNPPPILLVYGANDQVIPVKPTQTVIGELGNRALVRRYDKGYHMLLRDLQRAVVHHDVADWVLKRNNSPARPLSLLEPSGDVSMANTNKHDLRDGKPHAAPTTETQMPGHRDEIFPTPPSGQNPVNPGVGSKAGVAEGQVTKSN